METRIRATFRPPYTGPWELYDLEKDRTETNNLAAQHADVVAEMTALWDDWAKAEQRLSAGRPRMEREDSSQRKIATP